MKVGYKDKEGRKEGGGKGGGKEKRIGRIISRLSGRFASILYFNCEHFLFVYIVRVRSNKCEKNNYVSSSICSKLLNLVIPPLKGVTGYVR